MRYKLRTTIELDVTVIAYITPATPPVPCSDPDHPAYSDPGDPGERYIEAVLLNSKKSFTLNTAGLRVPNQIDITECLTIEELEALAEEAYTDAQE